MQDYNAVFPLRDTKGIQVETIKQWQDVVYGNTTGDMIDKQCFIYFRFDVEQLLSYRIVLCRQSR